MRYINLRLTYLLTYLHTCLCEVCDTPVRVRCTRMSVKVCVCVWCRKLSQLHELPVTESPALSPCVSVAGRESPTGHVSQVCVFHHCHHNHLQCQFCNNYYHHKLKSLYARFRLNKLACGELRQTYWPLATSATGCFRLVQLHYRKTACSAYIDNSSASAASLLTHLPSGAECSAASPLTHLPSGADWSAASPLTHLPSGADCSAASPLTHLPSGADCSAASPLTHLPSGADCTVAPKR